jgi:hypothetical protein
MAVLRQLDRPSALEFLRQLPEGATVYSHPMFGGTTFDARLARDAQIAGALPAGGKLAKITTDQVSSIHSAAGNLFRLWDGSSRRIAASLDAGAAGIVATPLSPFGENFPPRTPQQSRWPSTLRSPPWTNCLLEQPAPMR